MRLKTIKENIKVANPEKISLKTPNDRVTPNRLSSLRLQTIDESIGQR